MQRYQRNLNGSSKGALQTTTGDAVEALHNALVALATATPHGRDFLPQGGATYRAARDEHAARYAAVKSVYDDFVVLHLAIVEDDNG